VSDAADSRESTPEELAARCQTGCPDAFEALVGVFEARIYNFLCRFTGNPHDAEDLTQETFVKAFRGIRNYQPTHAFSTWLFTIAKRTAIKHFRSHRPTEPLADEEGDPGEAADHNDPGAMLAQKDEAISLWNLARRLKPKQHEALWLRYGEGFSVAETARIMETNQIHVKVLLHRARGRLAKLLGRPVAP
jgi:RNA polymerase sigma-70 factor (ECF subfamily)